MTDLDILRPEVRDAINRQDRQEKCDEYCPVCEDRATIRAELLRLAGVEAELAALKARIADAPEWYDHPDCVGISASGVMIGLHGKRVRLLVEDNVTSNQ